MSFAMVAAFWIYRLGAIFELWQQLPLSWAIAYAVITVGLIGLSTWKIVKHKSLPQGPA